MANTILTTIGRQKLISAAPERQVKIQSMVFGDGGGSPVSVNEDMQWVVNQVSMQPAAAPIRAGDNADIIMISAIIPRDVTGFTVREVGLVDADGDLIAIGASEPTDKKESPLSVRVYLKLDNASQVDLISDIGSPLDHSLLTGRDSFNAHDASAISYGEGTVADKLDELVSGAVTEPLVDAKVLAHNHDPSAHPELSDFISSEANRAEAARDAAQISANVYESVAEGLANTQGGDYFSVPEDGGTTALILYKKVATSAVEITRYASSEAFDQLSDVKKYVDYLETQDTVELINPSQIVEGSYIASTTGHLVSTTLGASASGFIPVFDGFRGIYIGKFMAGAGGIAAYDANKNFVKSVVNPGEDGYAGSEYYEIKIDDPRVKYIRATFATGYTKRSIIATKGSQALFKTLESEGRIDSVERDMRLNIDLLDGVSLIDNRGIIGATGVDFGDVRYECTPPIPVKPEYIITYRGYLAGTVGIAAYDDEGGFLEEIYSPSTNGPLLENEYRFNITNPSIKYIRASNRKADLIPMELIAEVLYSADYINGRFDAIESSSTIKKDLLDGVSLEQGQIVNAITGNVGALAGYEATPFIPVEYLSTVTYTGSVRESAGIAAYDENQYFVSTIYAPSVNGSIYGSFEFDINNPKIKYIRATNRVSDGVPLTLHSTIEYNSEVLHQLFSSSSAGTSRPSNGVRVRFVSPTLFWVDSVTTDGSFVSHKWEFSNRPQFQELGWKYTEVHHNGNYILQGNFNFIHIR